MQAEKILFYNGKKGYVRRTGDIVCVEARGHRTIIHTLTGTYSCGATLKRWEAQLSENCFLKTNRSFIVNLSFVESYDEHQVWLEAGGRKITALVSARSCYKKLREELENYYDSP